MKLAALACAVAAAAGSLALAAEPAVQEGGAGDLRWHRIEPLSEAARDASGGRATVWGDPPIGCYIAWAEVPAASGASDRAVRAGFVAGLREAGATLPPDPGDGPVEFVLGPYQGAARLARSESGAEVTACLCSDRYPERAEAACAQLWQR